MRRVDVSEGVERVDGPHGRCPERGRLPTLKTIGELVQGRLRDEPTVGVAQPRSASNAVILSNGSLEPAEARRKSQHEQNGLRIKFLVGRGIQPTARCSHSVSGSRWAAAPGPGQHQRALELA